MYTVGVKTIVNSDKYMKFYVENYSKNLFLNDFFTQFGILSYGVDYY